MGYKQELDISPELDPNAVSYYLSINNVLRWMIKWGRIDMITKVPLVSSHVAFPREGHLEAAINVMTHIGQRYDSRLVYDPSYQEIDDSVFKNVIGQSSIGMPRRLYPSMHKNLQVRRLTSACL